MCDGSGLISYMRSGAGSLFVDTLSVSKSAMVSAISRLGRILPGSKPKVPSKEDAAACGHGGLAAEQSARLANGDGLLAEDDVYLISGGPAPDSGITKMSQSPDDSTAADSVSAISASGSVLDGLGTDAGVMHIEMGSETHESRAQDSAAGSATATAAVDSSSMLPEKLSSDMVTAVMLDKRLASLGTGSSSVSRQLFQATQDMQTDTDRRNMVTDASNQVTNLGMAAVAVNEAELSLGEVKASAGVEGGPGPLAPGVSLPADVLDSSLMEGITLAAMNGASLGSDGSAENQGTVWPPSLLNEQHLLSTSYV